MKENLAKARTISFPEELTAMAVDWAAVSPAAAAAVAITATLII